MKIALHRRYETGSIDGAATDVDLVSPLHSFSYDSYKEGHMRSTKNPGRIGGFLYLLLVIAAPLRLINIPSKLFVHGNATATAMADDQRLGLSGHELYGITVTAIRAYDV